MAGKVKPVPEGFHTITPHLVVREAEKAIAFYKKAFGATDRHGGCIMKMPNGKIGHAELWIGDSPFMLADESPEWGCLSPLSKGGGSVGLHLYVADVDAAFKKAVAAGATVTMPVADMFWGDRYGKLKDPFGHEWSIGTHTEDVPPEDMKKRMEEAMSAHKCS